MKERIRTPESAVRDSLGQLQRDARGGGRSVLASFEGNAHEEHTGMDHYESTPDFELF